MKKLFLYQGFILINIVIFLYICYMVDIVYGYKNYSILKAIKLIIYIAVIFFIISIFLKEKKNIDNNIVHGIITILFLWFNTTIFCSIPFYYDGLNIYNAIFESFSGITTTGATIINDLETKTKGILLWRMILHFFGSIGIIIYISIVLPIFTNTELSIIEINNSTGIEEKVFPKNNIIYKNITILYCALILLCTTSYYLIEMNLFDSICHAISTVSTGGFFNYNTSFKHYDNIKIEFIACIFMIVSSLPFMMMLKIIITRKITLDKQSVLYFIQIALSLIIIISLLILYNEYDSNWLNIRYGSFNTISMLTTSGFSNKEYYSWNYLIPMLILLAVIGGCSGSTSGGIKIIRIYILFKIIYKTIVESCYKNILQPIGYMGKIVNNKLLISIAIFIILNITTTILSSIIISLYGYDFITSVTTSFSMVNNIGFTFGESTIYQNYDFLDNKLKLFLSFIMFVGRIEINPILIVIIYFIKKI